MAASPGCLSGTRLGRKHSAVFSAWFRESCRVSWDPQAPFPLLTEYLSHAQVENWPSLAYRSLWTSSPTALTLDFSSIKWAQYLHLNFDMKINNNNKWTHGAAQILRPDSLGLCPDSALTLCVISGLPPWGPVSSSVARGESQFPSRRPVV